jgi:CBS domain-containing protein
MSPRAARRLEAAGFDPVYDYVAGKSDWLAADLPYDGEAQLVGRFIRRDVPVVRSGATVGDALEQLEKLGLGPVLVLNQADVVMGALYRPDLEAAAKGAPAMSVARFGVSTVRPSEEVGPLLHRMLHVEVTRVVVTRSDGTLAGLFVADDAQPAGGHHH